MKKYIGVIGSGDGVQPFILNLAEEVGYRIAKTDAILVCGGRGGVMEAACRGAKNGGGLTVGILPGLEKDDANEYVDVAIPSGLGFTMRNTLTIRTCDAVIMIAGEVGTLAEAILSYQHAKPLVVLTTTGGWASRLQQVALEGGLYFDERRLMEITYAANPEQAVHMAISRIGVFPPPPKI